MTFNFRFTIALSLLLLGGLRPLISAESEPHFTPLSTFLVAPDEIADLIQMFCTTDGDSRIRTRVVNSYNAGESTGTEILLTAYRELLPREDEKGIERRACVLRCLASPSAPSEWAKSMLFMELDHPTSYPTAMAAAEGIRTQDVFTTETAWLTARVVTLDADVNAVDPKIVVCPPCPYSSIESSVQKLLRVDQAKRLDLYQVSCSALKSESECASVAGVIGKIEAAFADEPMRVQIVAQISSSQLPERTQMNKDAVKFIRKLVHELDKEKSIKPYLEREIRKELDPADPMTARLLETLEQLSEEELRQLINTLLPLTEERMLEIQSRMRDAMFEVVNGENRDAAARQTAERAAQWHEDYMREHSTPRPSVAAKLVQSLAELE